VELCTCCCEALILMGVTVLLSLKRQIKKTRSISSLERRPCCGIKDWDILEKRDFEHYTVKAWLQEILTAINLYICDNPVYIYCACKSSYMIFMDLSAYTSISSLLFSSLRLSQSSVLLPQTLAIFCSPPLDSRKIVSDSRAPVPFVSTLFCT
jgi:hypothetical protein